MVSFLECHGPTTVQGQSNLYPECSKCPGAEPIPCPFCESNNLNGSNGGNQSFEQNRNHCCNNCNCGFEPCHACPAMHNACCCCHYTCCNQMCGKGEPNLRPNVFECPWCSGKLVILRLDDDTYTFQCNKPQSRHCRFQDCNTNVMVSNNDKPSCTPCCPRPCCPHRSNVNIVPSAPEKSCNTETCCYNVDIPCRPKRSKMIIGGKLVSCPCPKKNGIQDDCGFICSFPKKNGLQDE